MLSAAQVLELMPKSRPAVAVRFGKNLNGRVAGNDAHGPQPFWGSTGTGPQSGEAHDATKRLSRRGREEGCGGP
jgi:hypothetical protein